MLTELLEYIDKNGNLKIDKKKVEKAFLLASKAHGVQKRESGEPYIVHPVEVAKILIDLGMDTDTIVAGLLHDVVEDTEYALSDIANLYGKDVANLVDGVTKLDKMNFKSKIEQKVENVRKMILATIGDMRVIIIKLADRLHNLRTLKYVSEDKQKEKAKETLDIYAPLAHRLGIYKIKWELEDLSFRYIEPEEFYKLVDAIAEKRVEREEFIEKIVKEIEGELLKVNLESEVYGRPKHLYSIYRKIKIKNKSLDEIFDLIAIRIIVEEQSQCYIALGTIHTLYNIIPGRFKDYIAMPKPNDYRSIHSTVIGEKGKPFEVQIRTREMHRRAEYGIAAHWKYKEGIEGNDSSEDIDVSFLSDILEYQKSFNPEEFMDSMKIDLYTNRIYVNSPKGQIIELNKDATPVDFAYKIHTELGNKCFGAKVNNKIVPLDTKLMTGDVVEIQTSNTVKGPSRDWLKFVASNATKNKIQSYFKKLGKEENEMNGRITLEKELKKNDIRLKDVISNIDASKIYKSKSINDFNELFEMIGDITLDPIDVVSRIIKIQKEEEKVVVDENERVEKIVEKIRNDRENSKQKLDNTIVVVDGEKNMLIRIAQCCTPVKGDDIAGYVTRGRGVSIHRTDCENFKTLSEIDSDKIIPVKWSLSDNSTMSAKLDIYAKSQTGFSLAVLNLLAELEVKTESFNASEANGVITVRLQIFVKDNEQLNDVIRRIYKLGQVTLVTRQNN